MTESVSRVRGFIRLARVLVGNLFLFVAVATATAEARASELLGVRFGERSATQTRIVFDLTGAPDYALHGDPEGDGAVIVEIAGLSAAVSEPKPGGGLVRRYAVSRGASNARFRLELAQSVKLDEAFVIPPGGGVSKHRLVIDVSTASRSAFLKSFPRKFNDLEDIIVAATEAPEPPVAAGPKATRPTPASAPRPAPTRANYPTIFIDAGHGGGDPGAVGVGGALEKTVTLEAAKKLAEILKKRGRYKIVMTRVDDTRLSLVQRNHLARRAAPDLFITIHADAHDDKKLRGGSVYTLSAKGAERSAREAKDQEDVRVGDLDMKEVAPELGEILYDFAQRETISASSRFADTLVKKLRGVTPLLNNSHRQANFYLLLAPDVPAVLLEMAYMSNAKDEANLTSEKWRAQTMTAVADAIDVYFSDRETRRSAVSSTGDVRDSG